MSNTKTEFEKQIDAVFSNDLNRGKKALVLMDKIITDLAATRNSDPLRRFWNKAIKHHHNNYSVVMGACLRLYFGDKAIILKKDDNHATGVACKLKFDGNPAPRNGYGFVSAAVLAGKAYNDKAFIKQIREHLKPEKPALDLEKQKEFVGGRIDSIIKAMDKEAPDVSLAYALERFKREWNASHVEANTNVPIENDEAEVVELDTIKNMVEAA